MSNWVLVKKEIIEETLRAESKQGKGLVEPLKSLAAEKNLPFKILEDKEVVNEAEVHRHEGDLWQCLEGEVTFICGGELVEPKAKQNPDGTLDEREWKGKAIQDGTEMVLRPGDWLWIPPGVAHQHNCKGIARMFIIKIPKV
ncbi:MAG: hypothetical protein A3I89_01995 [Candidatus Harrisonbacteria bacterium RIFCSPLOWO2_02_FULL_41_11]|uniref:JmjC domain-containing protein n=1 Tax=Candidatus Harrisonbacteria bacterium RIFCSPHIGHO2_02_FULL_42_16 TaxID=1798404 RepID=A0A1G1ZG76_9BACT|nr:MAG: hypothetical protein A3B92_01775 [Candidatus Harrisonbacteria bacterium RIFCSPHIGHO2_02_FULL_42_16]OGY65632.1 MAG: hypothetical protein A3I89_01995 [Candidatus Harrisonbacteria bacterium RIFCSPLOWO2_02_FULL_41_11]